MTPNRTSAPPRFSPAVHCHARAHLRVPPAWGGGRARARAAGSAAPTLLRLLPVLLLPLLLLALGAASASAQQGKPPSHVGKDGLSPEVARVLDDVRGKDTGQLAVSAEDGRFLRVLVAATGATRALEIGGASGYSAIWIGLGLRDTGGRLTTIEYDPVRAKELAANVKRAGLADIVTVVAGDAFAQVPKVPGEFDFVFLDAWKRDYKRFFELVSPRVVPGGLFLAHNVVNKRGEMQDFLTAIESARGTWSSIVSPSGEGISITYRRKR